MALTITDANLIQKVARHLLDSRIGDEHTLAAMRELEPLIARSNKTLAAGLRLEDYRAAVQLWDSLPSHQAAATGCICTPDPDTGELRDGDGWPCTHRAEP